MKIFIMKAYILCALVLFVAAANARRAAMTVARSVDHVACPATCKTCKNGGRSDGGLPTDSNGVCHHFCSKQGYCGNGDGYKTGDDCTECTYPDRCETHDDCSKYLYCYYGTCVDYYELNKVYDDGGQLDIEETDPYGIYGDTITTDNYVSSFSDYVVKPVNSSCEIGMPFWNAILDNPLDCENAATKLNIDFGDEEEVPDYPGGCYVWHATVYFNKNFDGAIEEESQPICGHGCQDTDNGKLDKYGFDCTSYSQYPNNCGKYDDGDFFSKSMCCGCKDYVAGPVNSICENRMIKDGSECEKVAKELNYDFGGDEDESDYPGGCYLYYEDTVYFNKNFCGAIQEQSQPICGPVSTTDATPVETPSTTCVTCPETCKTCKYGSKVDARSPMDSNGVCHYFCSKQGYCGDGDDYKTGDDCTQCNYPDRCETIDDCSKYLYCYYGTCVKFDELNKVYDDGGQLDINFTDYPRSWDYVGNDPHIYDDYDFSFSGKSSG